MARSYDISKQSVWRAYKRVKANQGSAGVDEQTLAEFEQDLKGNLYKIWNRLTSGTYIPPPVKSGRDTEEIGWNQGIGCSLCCRQSGTDCGEDASGTGIGKVLSPGLIWIQAREVGDRSSRYNQTKVLEVWLAV